jgi:epoxyqueuosine reductase
VEERVDPSLVLEGAQSIVAVGLIYDSEAPRGGPPSLAGVARYAGGDDYHDVMLDRLRALESGIAALVDGPIASRAYVDTGPVQERVIAAYAGLGWIGKNTCLIHPRLGSYLFLGVLLTDLPLDPDERGPDHCGSCRACLDACPTDAFAAPYTLDATRCISYATIESRGPIPLAQRAEHGSWVFGCDICQEVCPWNSRERRSIPADPLGLRARIAARSEWIQPSLEWILGLDEARWRAATRRTALRRTRYRGLIRNALVAAGNSADPSLCAAVRAHAASDDPVIAEHARWALARLASAAA